MKEPELPGDPRFVAAVDMIGRSGADEIQIGYHEEDEPIVWTVLAHWPEREGLFPDHFDAASGMTPWRAVFRLLEATLDGGRCRHCNKPSAIDDKPADDLMHATEEFVCWYRYDPELQTFRRSCEGVAE